MELHETTSQTPIPSNTFRALQDIPLREGPPTQKSSKRPALRPAHEPFDRAATRKLGDRFWEQADGWKSEPGNARIREFQTKNGAGVGDGERRWAWNRRMGGGRGRLWEGTSGVGAGGRGRRGGGTPIPSLGRSRARTNHRPDYPLIRHESHRTAMRIPNVNLITRLFGLNPTVQRCWFLSTFLSFTT